RLDGARVGAGGLLGAGQRSREVGGIEALGGAVEQRRERARRLARDVAREAVDQRARRRRGAPVRREGRYLRRLLLGAKGRARRVLGGGASRRAPAAALAATAGGEREECQAGGEVAWHG